ncbi:MAG: DUF3619 family protein [Roseateles sp.]
MKSSQILAPTELDARLEASARRFGLRVAAGLTERSATLPHEVSERLRFAREQALARAAQARAAASAAAAAAASPQVMGVGSTLALGGAPRGSRRGGSDLWAMLASALPLLLLAAGLLLIEHGQVNEQIAAAAEVDTALLSDDLPPAAFTDPGFAEYLRDAED